MKKFLNWTGETNIFIGLAAGIFTAGSYAFFDAPIDWYLAAFTACATAFTYNLQRKIGDIKANAVFQKAKWAVMAIASAGMIVFALYLEWLELAALTFVGLISVAYALPVIPWKAEKYSLRRIPYLKIWVIVVVWIAGTCVIPLMEMLDLSSFDDKLAFIFFLFQQSAFILALTIPFDIRDLAFDEAAQRTLPMIMGSEKSIWLAKNLVVLSFLSCLFNYLIGFFSFPVMVFELIFSFVVWAFLKKGHHKKDAIYYTIVLDGMILLQGMAVVLISKVFN